MKKFWPLSWGALSIVLLVGLIFATLNARALEDWFKLRNYNPPPRVVSLATEDTMTNRARHIFYVNHPDIVNSSGSFRQVCPTAEQTIVLGCYHSDQRGIYIYNVQDSRLNGVLEVTAAHEMLHGAYDRLSHDDKLRINNLLTNYYNNDLQDQRIIDDINSYKKTEPDQLVNEMHSIFGTEAPSLPPELESYYKQYFQNRQSVVRFADQYESVFDQNQKQLDNLRQQIEQLKSELNTDKATIDNEQTALIAERRRMQDLLNSGQVNEYNAAVDSYNARLENLQNLISSYNSRVNQLNDLVDQYNILAQTQESLYKSLDTSLSPQTAQ